MELATVTRTRASTNTDMSAKKKPHSHSYWHSHLRGRCCYYSASLSGARPVREQSSPRCAPKAQGKQIGLRVDLGSPTPYYFTLACHATCLLSLAFPLAPNAPNAPPRATLVRLAPLKTATPRARLS